MSLCCCSILKPSYLNRQSDFVSRWAPNPIINHVRFLNLQTHGRDYSFRAVHTDGVGILYPDDTVSERSSAVGAETEGDNGAVNGVAGTPTEEFHGGGIRLKESGRNVEESDKGDRFKLRNGREVFEEKAYLVGVARKGETEGSFSIEESLGELEQLADTAGLRVVGSTYQKLTAPNPRTYIGSGKLAEIKSAIDAFDIETVIFDDELSPDN